MTDFLFPLFIALGLFALIPALTFLIVRAGTLGYLAARRRYEEINRNS